LKQPAQLFSNNGYEKTSVVAGVGEDELESLRHEMAAKTDPYLQLCLNWRDCHWHVLTKKGLV